jgi:hypothetical protein
MISGIVDDGHAIITIPFRIPITEGGLVTIDEL